MIESVKCKVCQHPQRVRIELGMIKGLPNRTLEEQYGPGRMSMQRHKEAHLPGRIREDSEKAGTSLEAGGNLAEALSKLDADLERVARKAERKGQHSAAVAAIKERKAIAELKARASGELAPEGAARDMTLVVAMDPAAAERALSTWAQRRGALPPAGEDPEVIESEAVTESQVTDKKLTKGELAILAARRDFGAFISLLWPEFQRPPHVELLVQKFEAIVRGDLRRVMVSAPPRHGKSATLSVYGVAFFLGRLPRASVMSICHSQELANDFGWQVRAVMSNQVYRQIFPEAELDPTVMAVGRLRTRKGGSYVSSGRDGVITGRGADLLLIDDLVKGDDEMTSGVLRRQIQRWFGNVATTRLAPKGRILIVNTRWHQDDLCGWIIREHPKGWDVVNLPAIAEAGDVLGREEGEALWPERFSIENLEEQRELMGTHSFGALYQGRPSPLEGSVFKLEWFQYYRQPPPLETTVLSMDTAFKAKGSADFSVMQVWGLAKTGYVLLDVFRKRVEFPELERAAIAWAAKWNPRAVLIEDRASGQSLIQALQRGTRLPIRPVKVSTDKVSRATAVTPLIESGRVFLPERAPWLADFLDEVTGFPTSTHDDNVDCLTQALAYMREHCGGTFIYRPVRGAGASDSFDERHGDFSGTVDEDERDRLEDLYNLQRRRYGLAIDPYRGF